MKKNRLKLTSLFFLLFVGSAAMAQSATMQSNPSKTYQTLTVNGHEAFVFNSIEDKATWVQANPEAYALKVEEAGQVSSTFLGTLLQVRPKATHVKTERKATIGTSSTSRSNN